MKIKISLFMLFFVLLNSGYCQIKSWKEIGQLIYHQNSVSNGSEIDLSHIPSQLLYIELGNKNNQRTFKKVIKL